MGYPMDYTSVSSITTEIASLAPIFKAGINEGQWPFLEDGRFRTPNGLAQLHLAEFSENLEVKEFLGSLL